MAITRIGGANAISGVIPTSVGGTGSTASTLPASLINNTSIGNVTALPAAITTGTVLQYKEDYDGDFINLNTTSWVDTALSIAVTPTSATSTIVVAGMVNCYVSGNHGSYHGLMQYKMQKDGSDFGETYNIYSGYGGLQALINAPLPFAFSETAGSTSERTYKIQVRNQSTQTGSSHNQYSGYSVLQIWEIAA